MAAADPFHTMRLDWEEHSSFQKGDRGWLLRWLRGMSNVLLEEMGPPSTKFSVTQFGNYCTIFFLN